MKIISFIWLPAVIEKLETKHHVTPEEVEEVFKFGSVYRRGPKGKRRGENLYYAYGHTEAGRYLFVVFIYKVTCKALILSARDMTRAEQSLYKRMKS